MKQTYNKIVITYHNITLHDFGTYICITCVLTVMYIHTHNKNVDDVAAMYVFTYKIYVISNTTEYSTY